MKRPRTWRERGWLFAFAGIILFDVVIFAVVVSALIFEFSPYPYNVAPTVCFSYPQTPIGQCDVWTFNVIQVSSVYGDVFVQQELVNMSTNAYILNPALNNSTLRIYFGFMPQGVWQSGNKPNPCFTTIPPPYGISLRPINHTKYPNTSSDQWFGEGATCFLYQGSFTPLLVVVNGTQTTFLHEGEGQSYSLVVDPPTTVQNFNYAQGELFFALVIVFFASYESFNLLLDIHPKAFPRRIEYPKQPRRRDEKAGSPEHPDKIPEGEPRPESAGN